MTPKSSNKNTLHTFVVLAYKESPYLEECILSTLNQKYPSEVIIATSTPNEYIKRLARKYKLEVKVNYGDTGIGADFDFAISAADTKLVTVAHQDDIFDPDYSKSIISAFAKSPDSLILFTDYYEIRNNKKIKKSPLLTVKKILLLPLLLTSGKTKLSKRLSLSFGNPICCPAVTFNINKISFPVFNNGMKCDVDWHAWEQLSKKEGNFTLINKKLMGHRIHEGSTTTQTIQDNIRTKEDYEILCRFWPKWIAKIVARMDAQSEHNNQVKDKQTSPNLRKNFIWNFVGTTFSAFISLFLMMAVTHLNGVEDAGIFTFAFATAAIFQIIGVYSGRTFQVTDKNNNTTDTDYFYTKFASCGVMFLVALIFCLVRGYDLGKLAVVLALTIFRLLEAFSESIYAVIQKKDRLYQVGKSFFFKAILGITGFVIVDLLTHNLLLACSMLIVAQVIVLALYDLPCLKKTEFILGKLRIDRVGYIFKIGFFTFGFMILNLYLVNAARYTIDELSSNEVQMIFGIMIMPATVITLAAQYMIQPFLTTLKKSLYEDINKFWKLTVKICAIILGFGVVCIVAAALLGIPVLELLYGVELDGNLSALLLVLFGGTCSAMVTTLSTALTTMRQTGMQFVAFLVASVLALIFSYPLVGKYDVLGGCLTYLISMGVLLMVYIIVYIYQLQQFKKNPEKEYARAKHE